MKRPKQDRIYYDDFKAFCLNFPSAMDFISRITIGECPDPNSDDSQNQIFANNRNYLIDNNNSHEQIHEKERIPAEKPFFNKRWVKF